MQKYGNAANGVDKVAGWITNQADVSAESLSCNYDFNLNSEVLFTNLLFELLESEAHRPFPQPLSDESHVAFKGC